MKIQARTWVLLFYVAFGIRIGLTETPSSSFGETFVFMAVVCFFALIFRYAYPVCTLHPQFREVKGALILPSFCGPIFQRANRLQQRYDLSILIQAAGLAALITSGIFHFALSFGGFFMLVIGMAQLLALEAFVSDRQLRD